MRLPLCDRKLQQRDSKDTCESWSQVKASHGSTRVNLYPSIILLTRCYGNVLYSAAHPISRILGFVLSVLRNVRVHLHFQRTFLENRIGEVQSLLHFRFGGHAGPISQSY